MGDLFGQFAAVNPEVKNDKLDALIAYEEHYMKLLRNYKNEIAEMEKMQRQVREEREEFYRTTLPRIEQAMEDDHVLSAEAKKEWISELRNNMEKSFLISEELIAHYTTSNLEEFKKKMEEAVGRV